FDPLLREREHEVADASGGERIGGDTAGFAIDGMAGLECAIEGWGAGGFDADDAHAALIPGRDSSNEAAASAGHQQSIDLRGLLLEFEADAALPEEGFRLIVGMDGHRAGSGGPLFAGEQRVVVSFPGDDEVRTVAADAVHLGGRCHFGHEDARWVADLLCGPGDSDTMITARGGDHTV